MSKGKYVKKLRFGYEVTCDAGTGSGTVSIGGRVKIKNRRFSYSSTGTWVSGKFKTRTKAKGKLRVTSSRYDPFNPLNKCDSGSVAWTVKKR